MTHRVPRIGLLPLYLELYDRVAPGWRARLEVFARRVAGEFTARGIAVRPAGVCRVAGEFRRAVASFERERVDCIVTLHLAYSPSLESADALARSPIPILMLDTTMDRHFGRGTDPDRIGFNHGIHGVMDLASVLRRRGRSFGLVAGHASDAGMWTRAVGGVRAAQAARAFRGTRALRVGKAFRGMGDFQVEPRVLRRALGISVTEIPARDLVAAARRLKPAAVHAEMATDRGRYDCSMVSPQAHERSVRAGLALRHNLDAGRFTAFSMDFRSFAGAGAGIETVPFLEACNAMARGIGYSGEGDVLTASLVGALQRAFGRTTFTEIFCPDWAGHSLFLSHMGEINPAVAAAKPRLFEKPLVFTGTKPPVLLTCAPAPGPAVFVNLAPGPHDTFTLICAPVEVLGDAEREDMRTGIRGWIRPRLPIPTFLEAYSRAGGTHHSALVLGQAPEALGMFAAFAGLDFLEIR